MTRPLIHSGRLATGKSYLAVLVRRVYRIQPGARAVASTAENASAIVEEQYATSGNLGASDSLVQDSDVAGVLKPFTDVVLHGFAHARGRAVTMLDTALQVERARKAVRVWGDRRIAVGRGGAPTYESPVAFTSFPLLYDHAFGGCDELATTRSRTAAASEGEPVLPGVASYPRNGAGRCYIVDSDAGRLAGVLAPNLEDPTDPATPDRLLSTDMGADPTLQHGFEYLAEG